MSSPNKRLATTTTTKGAYASLQLVDAATEGPLTCYTASSRPATERWAKCEWNKEFWIRCENHSKQNLAVKVLVDGATVADKVILAGTVLLLKDVRVGYIQTGQTSKAVYKPLIFTQPSFGTGGNGGGGQLASGADKEIAKLGRVSMQVYDLVLTEPVPMVATVAAGTMAGKVDATEKACIKKGRFCMLMLGLMKGDGQKGYLGRGLEPKDKKRTLCFHSTNLTERLIPLLPLPAFPPHPSLPSSI